MASHTPEMLSADDVLRIHEFLVLDFTGTADPVAPAGLRSRALLESAVGRQFSGHGSVLKYPDPVANAATLAFGLCNDHPFLNGNKRTALVAMLVHLDKNHLCLHETNQNDLFRFMLDIANHSLGFRPDPRRPDKTAPRRPADDEVNEIRSWISERVHKVRRGERPVTFRQLRQILGRFGLTLDDPNNNGIGVFKTEVKRGLFRRQTTERRQIATIGYRDEGTEVSLKDLKHLRDICGLSEADGVDTDAFYKGTDVVDSFVNRYRTVLRRLAKT
jgi:death-on-curing protein